MLANSIQVTGVSPSTFSNISGHIKLIFHMEAPTLVCSHSPGHVTKMAATSIYGKIPLNIFSRTRRMRSDLLCSIGDVRSTKILGIENTKLQLLSF